MCIHRDQRGKRERGSNVIYLFSSLLCSFSAVVFSLLFVSLFFLPAGLRPVSSSSSCCFVRATVSCFPSPARRLFLLQLFWLSCIYLSFFRAPGAFLLSFNVFLLLWSRSFCCAVVPGTPAFHLLHCVDSLFIEIVVYPVSHILYTLCL